MRILYYLAVRRKQPVMHRERWMPSLQKKWKSLYCALQGREQRLRILRAGLRLQQLWQPRTRRFRPHKLMLQSRQADAISSACAVTSCVSCKAESAMDDMNSLVDHSVVNDFLEAGVQGSRFWLSDELSCACRLRLRVLLCIRALYRAQSGAARLPGTLQGAQVSHCPSCVMFRRSLATEQLSRRNVVLSACLILHQQPSRLSLGAALGPSHISAGIGAALIPFAALLEHSRSSKALFKYAVTSHIRQIAGQ